MGRVLGGSQAELFQQLLVQPRRPRDVARRAPADHDHVPSLGLEPELVIEGGHPVDVAVGVPRVLRDPPQGVHGEVPQLALDLLKYGYERTRRVAHVAIAYAVH